VLFHVRATDSVYTLAAALAARMREKAGGRMWLGAHMRRGDCTCRAALASLPSAADRFFLR
jgi:hypothetical protein